MRSDGVESTSGHEWLCGWPGTASGRVMMLGARTTSTSRSKRSSRCPKASLTGKHDSSAALAIVLPTMAGLVGDERTTSKSSA